MIDCDNLSLTAGVFHLRGVSLQVAAQAYAVLMGPTGCGKTTLLEAICGLRPLESGCIRLDGHDVSKLRPSERNIGYVPQEGAVFTRMTVGENLAFALELRRRPQSQIRHRVAMLAERLAITHLLDRRAVGLSGGEVQRVALGRALAAEPRVLLLDEPLSALDETTREQLMALLKDVQQETGTTTLHVTHSRLEADRLADVRFEMQDGRVITAGVPAGNAAVDGRAAVPHKPTPPTEKSA